MFNAQYRNGAPIDPLAPNFVAIGGKDANGVGRILDVDPTGKMLAPAPRSGTLINRSGTASGSSQTVAGTNAARQYFLFQAPKSNSASLWVNPLGGTAVGNSPQIEVPPGSGFAWTTFVPTSAITVIGTAADVWTAYEA